MNRSIAILLILSFSFGYAQDLSGLKICIDPGHGGHESDDRHILATDFWESESNLTKALELDTLLSALGASVKLTRYANDDNVADDPSLSQRVSIANQYDADFFHSIHSNGWNGERNSTLMLFQGFDNDPTWDEAKELSDIMVLQLYNAHRTTHYSVRGDFDFYGTGEAYLGVLKGLLMPGTLSEGSFHDYIPESWRLQNLDYRKHESWAIARSFIDYYNVGSYGVGEIAGVVRNSQMTVDYFYLTGTNDAKAPVNNMTVTVTPGDLVYHGDELNNGWFLFDSLAPGQYKVVFAATNFYSDSTTVTVTANNTVFADCWLDPDSNWVAPPETPENIHVYSISDSSLQIVYSAAARADSYVVYISTDGTSFTDSVVTESNTVLITGLTDNQPYYFKLRAVNGTGRSALTAKLYGGAPSSGDMSILLVNGFDRGTNTRHDYVRFYGTPITATGYGFSYCQNEEVASGRLSLLDYDAVIWMLGDESTADETFSTTEQGLVKTYLDAGGYLFVSGAEIGWDLEAKGISSDISFYHNYLKADYVADAPDNKSGVYYGVVPVAGTIFGGIADVSYDNGNYGTIDVDWPDAIIPFGTSKVIMKYKNTTTYTNAGIAYEGTFPNGTAVGRLVYLAFPFEAIIHASSRNEVMARVLGFFDGTNVSVDSDPLIPTEITLYQNYPNPFNPVTNISFSLPRPAVLNLSIYDINGRLVRTIAHQQFIARQNTLQWDSRNNSGKLQSSGLYFYRLSGNGINLTRQMTLLK